MFLDKDCYYIAKRHKLRPARCCRWCHKEDMIYEVKLLKNPRVFKLCCKTLECIKSNKLDWDWDGGCGDSPGESIHIEDDEDLHSLDREPD